MKPHISIEGGSAFLWWKRCACGRARHNIECRNYGIWMPREAWHGRRPAWFRFRGELTTRGS